MNRRQVIKKLRKAAKDHGLEFDQVELTRHTAIKVGDTSKTLGRHNEIDETTAGSFWDQFADELGGKGWWR